MATRYQLPTLEDLSRLGRRQSTAITVYAQTSPIVSERSTSRLNARSGFDSALAQLKDAGLHHKVEAALREQWDAIMADADLWAELSSSLAIFLTPETSEVYVLPNHLENQCQGAEYFDLGQLVRAVTSPQQAFALTLSANGWKLWSATSTTRATELELTGDHPSDAADATNRIDIRGRNQGNRLVGDEGRKTLLDTYAKRVVEAVGSELGRLDPNGERPLFVFATDPLVDLYRAAERHRQVVPVHGAPDELRPDQIDAAIRESLSAINSERISARLEQFGNDLSAGLVATDLASIARAAVAGAVQTLVYDFTIDVLGTIDETSGEVTYAADDEPGYDLLSWIAVRVLQGGGEAIAVRADEVSATIWNRTAVAHLRFALS